MKKFMGIVVSLACALTVMASGTAQAAPVSSAWRTIESPVAYTTVVEPYARYQPQTKCRRRAKAGIRLLAEELVARGGGMGPITRSCAGSSRSEHKEARAFDWMLDANKRSDRRLAKAFLNEILATDELGNPHALARRMGIMYIIWKDRIYSAYDGFSKRRYLSSGCKKLKRCSKTLRHRDHVHISLTRKAAKGRTSWYQEHRG